MKTQGPVPAVAALLETTYGPVAFGDETLWLPVEMTALDAKAERRMTARYSNYHRYAATVPIHDAKEANEP